MKNGIHLKKYSTLVKLTNGCFIYLKSINRDNLNHIDIDIKIHPLWNQKTKFSLNHFFNAKKLAKWFFRNK